VGRRTAAGLALDDDARARFVTEVVELLREAEYGCEPFVEDSLH